MAATNIQYLNPPELSKPTGYTHVIQVRAGRTVYIAGQVAFDKSGNVVGKGDFAAQTTQVFENLKSALAAAGATRGGPMPYGARFCPIRPFPYPARREAAS